MPRKVIYTGAHTLSGTVRLPNGATGFGRPPGPTGPSWCAYGIASATADTCSAIFETRKGDDSTDVVTARLILGSDLGAVTGSVNLDDIPGPSPNPPNYGQGRGWNGQDTIEGTFSFSVESELCLYTGLRRELPDGWIPDDLYPNYGGPRTPGEYPETDCWLQWEPVEGATVTGTATIGPKTLTLTAPGSTARFEGTTSLSATVAHTPAGDGSSSFLPLGVVETTITLQGGDPSGATAAKTYYVGGVAAGGAEVGAGYARAWTDTALGTVANTSDGSGVGASGSFLPTRMANVSLDAYAMCYPHPHACEWKAVLGYKGVSDTADGDGYYAIIDPPEPVLSTLTGQAVSAAVSQEYYALSVGASKSFDTFARSGRPARGYLRDGSFVIFDHYQSQQGPVYAWIVPPPGEDPNDWRVGFRGREEDALSVSHAASLALELGSGTADGDDTDYDFSPAKVLEGYRFAEVASPDGATALVIQGKTYPLSNTTDPQTVDLCFPSPGAFYDTQNTRFPLDADRLSTVNTTLWGVSNTLQIKAKDGSLGSFTLKEGSAGSKGHALAPFLPWQQEVPDDELTTGGGDDYTVEHYCLRGFLGDVDGRQGHEVPCNRKTVNNAPGRLYTTGYQHLAVSELPALFAEIPGWTATVLSTDGGDMAAYLMGLGYTKASGVWTKGFDKALGTYKAQPLYDSVEWPGDVRSDVFLMGGGSGLQLCGRKVMRGAAYGAIRDTAPVNFSDYGGANLGSATVAGKRYGLAGPTLADSNDWGQVWTDPGHKASFGGVPRLIERGAFDVGPTGGGYPHLARSLDDGAMLLTLAKEGSVTTKTLKLGGDPIEGTVGDGDSAQGYIRPTSDGAYCVFRSKDGETTESRSYDQGATWNDVMDTIPGENPAVEVNDHTGEAFVATWTDPGWDCYYKEPHDPDEDPPFVFVTHIADGPKGQASLRFDPGSDGALLFAYFDGSDSKLLYGRDQGATWNDS